MASKLQGVDHIRARLAALAEVPERLRSEVLPEAGASLLTRAQALVPVNTGELRDSGYFEVADGRLRVGFTAEHAAEVHERLDVAHEEGQAKFLERAQLEQEGDVRATLVAVVREAIE